MTSISQCTCPFGNPAIGIAANCPVHNLYANASVLSNSANPIEESMFMKGGNSDCEAVLVKLQEQSKRIEVMNDEEFAMELWKNSLDTENKILQQRISFLEKENERIKELIFQAHFLAVCDLVQEIQDKFWDEFKRKHDL
jgi:hypothetical protein